MAPPASRWVTITQHAFCSNCEWFEHEIRTLAPAREHHRETGHTVQVQRGQSFVYEGLPASVYPDQPTGGTA